MSEPRRVDKLRPLGRVAVVPGVGELGDGEVSPVPTAGRGLWVVDGEVAADLGRAEPEPVVAEWRMEGLLPDAGSVVMVEQVLLRRAEGGDGGAWAAWA
jgi:hypothetical protein